MVRLDSFIDIVCRAIPRFALYRPNNNQERCILQDPQTPLMIVAGPGAGKTTVLVLRALRLVYVDGIQPKSIVVNELAPGGDDLEALKVEIAVGQTDVAPVAGSPDYYALNAWQGHAAVPQFSFGFRFARAVRVVPVTDQSQDQATSNFDQVVRLIENCVANEERHGTIGGQWDPCGDSETCVACDFRHFCPNPSPRGQAPRQISAPGAP